MLLPLTHRFWIRRDNRTQQKAIIRFLRCKLGIKNRTAKMLAHECMVNYREQLANYDFWCPFEYDNGEIAVRFLSKLDF